MDSLTTINLLLAFIAFLGTLIIGLIVYVWKRREEKSDELINEVSEMKLELQATVLGLKNLTGWMKNNTGRLNELNSKLRIQQKTINELKEDN